MNCIFVDLELNQPSNIIIQIGATSVNLKTGKELSAFNIYANPGEILNPFIIELTGIQQHHVDQAPSVAEALKAFWLWVENAGCGGKILAWGDDIILLRRASRELGVQVPKLRDLNFKEMVKWIKSARGLPEKGGLGSTLTQFGLQFDGVPHNALDDARNTGRLGIVCFSLLRTLFQIQQLAKTLV